MEIYCFCKSWIRTRVLPRSAVTVNSAIIEVGIYNSFIKLKKSVTEQHIVIICKKGLSPKLTLYDRAMYTGLKLGGNIPPNKHITSWVAVHNMLPHTVIKIRNNSGFVVYVQPGKCLVVEHRLSIFADDNLIFADNIPNNLTSAVHYDGRNVSLWL